METAFDVFLYSMAGLVVASPIIFCALKYGFFKSLTASLVLCTILVVSMYWGADVYSDVRLATLGYDAEGMSELNRLEKVPIEHRAEAIQLYESGMGVGWPLSVIMVMILIVGPYNLFVIGLIQIIRRYSRKYDNS